MTKKWSSEILVDKTEFLCENLELFLGSEDVLK